MQCKESDELPFNNNKTECFIKDYAYYNNANYQLWINIDFSIPKEMQAFFKSQKKLYEDEIEFIPCPPRVAAEGVTNPLFLISADMA